MTAAIALALVSALVYGVSDYSGGRAARTLPVLAVSLVSVCTGLLVATVVVAILGDPFPPGSDVAWSAASGLMSLVGAASFYAALAGGTMSVVAPVTAVISAVVPVVVGFAGGERPTLLSTTGIVVAIVAVALVSGASGGGAQRTPRRIAGLAVLAGLGFGLLFVFLDRTGDDSGVWPLFIGQVTSIPVLAAIVVVRRIPITGFPRRHVLAFVAGALAVTANICYLLATRQGLLSLVAVITALYPASTVALATLIDGERMSRSQVAGLGLVVVALGMVTAGS